MTEKLQEHIKTTINDMVTPLFKFAVITLREEAVGITIGCSFDYMSLDGSGRCDFTAKLVEISDDGILVKQDVKITPISSMN